MLFEKQPVSSKEEENIQPVTTSLNRRTMIKRLGIAAATGTLALSISPALVLADNDNRSDDTSPRRKPSGFNVLLVHGAFADASSWNQVISLLQKEGHNVLAVQLPLTSLADDVAVTQQALASATLTGPTVLAGHSYGGAVITGAATGAANAIGLVYASAFAPAEGESLLDVSANAAPPQAISHTIPSYRNGFAWIDPAYYPQAFAADVDPAQARVMAVTQKPIAFKCFVEKSGPAAWQKLPSWYLVSKQDKEINPDLERFMANRIGATTIELNSSHASPVVHPHAIAGLIEAAIKHYKKA